MVFNMAEVRIKKAVIREDLLSITNDYRKAIILNQFIYWSERVSDADKFIQKENEIANSNGEEERELFYGWIYKTAEELADEVMLGLSASQIRRYISDLVDMGYISKRNNPKYKWDRTLQYRVNLVNIAKDLKKNGYPLSDYRIEIQENEKSNAYECAINNEPMKNQTQVSEEAIPENTTNNTNRDYYSEITKKDKTLSNDNVEVKTSSSESRKKMSPPKTNLQKYIDKKADEQDMMKRLANICMTNYDDETAREIFETIEYYFRRYTDKTGLIHPILTDKTLERMADKMNCFYDSKHSHFERLIKQDHAFMKMVDMFFDSDFGAVNGNETNYNLPAFMTDGILNPLGQRLFELGEV